MSTAIQATVDDGPPQSISVPADVVKELQIVHRLSERDAASIAMTAVPATYEWLMKVANGYAESAAIRAFLRQEFKAT